MHIMTRQIQTDQSLKYDTPSRKRLRQEDKQAGSGTAVSDHIEYGAETGGLGEVTCGVAVDGVEEAGDAVEEAAGAGVEGHVVEGCYCEDDARVACKIDVSV